MPIELQPIGGLIDFRLLCLRWGLVVEINKWLLLLCTAPYGSNQAQGWQLGPVPVTCSWGTGVSDGFNANFLQKQWATKNRVTDRRAEETSQNNGCTWCGEHRTHLSPSEWPIPQLGQQSKARSLDSLPFSNRFEFLRLIHSLLETLSLVTRN